MPERVVSLAVEERLDPERLRRAAPREDGEYRHYAAMREAVKPSLGLAYGLPTIDGYDGGLLPTRDYARFKSLLVPAQAPVAHYTLPPQAEGKADSALLGALNVRYVLSDGRNGSPGPGWTLRESAPGAAWLYENEGQRVLPRAWLVERVIPAPEPEEAALERLASLDLAREALVHLPPDDLPPEPGVRRGPDSRRSRRGRHERPGSPVTVRERWRSRRWPMGRPYWWCRTATTPAGGPP